MLKYQLEGLLESMGNYIDTLWLHLRMKLDLACQDNNERSEKK